MGAAIIDFRVCTPLVKCQKIMLSEFIDTLMYGFSSTVFKNTKVYSSSTKCTIVHKQHGYRMWRDRLTSSEVTSLNRKWRFPPFFLVFSDINPMFSEFIDTLMYGFSSTGITIYCYFDLKFNDNTCCEVICKRRYNDNDIMTTNNKIR
jgi:uncharacterized protein YlaN (UPF0358 family)